MLTKEGSRWTLAEISRIPSVQLMAIFAPKQQSLNTEFEVLKKVNAIRESKGLPPLTRLMGKKAKG